MALFQSLFNEPMLMEDETKGGRMGFPAAVPSAPWPRSRLEPASLNPGIQTGFFRTGSGAGAGSGSGKARNGIPVGSLNVRGRLASNRNEVVFRQPAPRGLRPP